MYKETEKTFRMCIAKAKLPKFLEAYKPETLEDNILTTTIRHANNCLLTAERDGDLFEKAKFDAILIYLRGLCIDRDRKDFYGAIEFANIALSDTRTDTYAVDAETAYQNVAYYLDRRNYRLCDNSIVEIHRLHAMTLYLNTINIYNPDRAQLAFLESAMN